jgi:D-sedoheptulose 7-phosphate isomerase
MGARVSVADAYYGDLRRALEAGPPRELEDAAAVLRNASMTYAFGNGASAALASHIATDLGKGRRLRIVSLVDNAALVTAYANDENYECVFEEQLRRILRPGDAVLGISASGGSENVVCALAYARSAGAQTIGFTGDMPSWQRMAEHCDVVVRAPLREIEQIEDLHVVFAHILMRMLGEQ